MRQSGRTDDRLLPSESSQPCVFGGPIPGRLPYRWAPRTLKRSSERERFLSRGIATKKANGVKSSLLLCLNGPSSLRHSVLKQKPASKAPPPTHPPHPTPPTHSLLSSGPLHPHPRVGRTPPLAPQPSTTSGPDGQRREVRVASPNVRPFDAFALSRSDGVLEMHHGVHGGRASCHVLNTQQKVNTPSCAPVPTNPPCCIHYC